MRVLERREDGGEFSGEWMPVAIEQTGRLQLEDFVDYEALPGVSVEYRIVDR